MSKSSSSKLRKVIRETVKKELAEKASEEYCKNTPKSEMGFTQKASCKAQGYIARSDGKKRKSDKYKESVQEGYSSDEDFAESKLKEVMKFAKMIHRKIEGRGDLPEWVVEKFSVAAHDLNEVFQYLDNQS